MATVQRPRFYEGQILGAGDLAAGQDHGRAGRGRHERLLHSWGIATGLSLAGADRTLDGTDYIDVTVGTGMAVDGHGRQIAVLESQTLSETAFVDSGVRVDDEEAWYPVVLVAEERLETAPTASTSRCGNDQPDRVAEGFQVLFDGPGQAADLDEQAVPGVRGGPGDSTSVTAWRVLLGFVQWNRSIGRFAAVADAADGQRRRYVGVRAEEVVAPGGGRVVLRTHDRTESDRPALVVEAPEDDGNPRLLFGLQTSEGSISPMFTVSASGDVRAEGNIEAGGSISGLLSSAVYSVSGVASDGVVLPLPAGLTQAQVDDGAVDIHTFVRPRGALSGEPRPPGETTGTWSPLPLECRVDEDRRVHCRIRWVQFLPAADLQDHPGACDFLVVATAANGGS